MKTDLQQRGNLLCSNLQHRLDVCFEILRSIEQLYATSQTLNQSDFQTFVRPMLLRHPSIYALEWLPYISHAERLRYEQTYGPITENNLQGGIRRAEDRTGYFPVTFIEPLQPNRLALGFDLASDPIRWQSLEQARQQSTIVVSQRIELVQDPDQGLGFLVILPIYTHHPHDSGETLPAQTLHGFIIGVFRLVDILKSAIQGLDLDRIDILLRDLSAPLTAGFLAYYSSHPGAVMADRSTEATLDRLLNGHPDGIPESSQPDPDRPICYRSLMVADRQWSLLLLPQSGYVDVVTLASQEQANAQAATARAEYFRLSIEQLRQAQERWLVERRWISLGLCFIIGILGGLIYLSVLSLLASLNRIPDWLTLPGSHLDLLEILEINGIGMAIVLFLSVWIYHLGQRQIAERTSTESTLLQTTTEMKNRIQVQQVELDSTRELVDLKLRFFSMASHEFRTPLSTILLSAQSLQKLVAETKPRKYLNRITQAADLMTQILSDILTITRAETGYLTSHQDWIELEQVCRQVMEEVDDPEQPRIQWNSSDQPCKVYTDGKILHSILTNLLTNALKYSSAIVQLRLWTDHDQAVVQIQDQGIGIPAAEIPFVFDPFHRGKNVGDVSGSGLGLAVVKVCVTQLKGSIQVDSQPGIGTTFTVWIPLQGAVLEPLPQLEQKVQGWQQD